MRKINSNSIWNSSPPERRKMFEEWLFEERVGYREAQERAFREWNVTGSLMSICRFYKRIEKERVISDMGEALETAKEDVRTGAAGCGPPVPVRVEGGGDAVFRKSDGAGRGEGVVGTGKVDIGQRGAGDPAGSAGAGAGAGRVPGGEGGAGATTICQ